MTVLFPLVCQEENPDATGNLGGVFFGSCPAFLVCKGFFPASLFGGFVQNRAGNIVSRADWKNCGKTDMIKMKFLPRFV